MPLVVYDQETITVGAQSVGLTAGKLQPTGPEGRPATAALIVAKGSNSVLVSFLGDDPTANASILLDPSDSQRYWMLVYGIENLVGLRMQRSGGADGLVYVLYYHGSGAGVVLP